MINNLSYKTRVWILVLILFPTMIGMLVYVFSSFQGRIEDGGLNLEIPEVDLEEVNETIKEIPEIDFGDSLGQNEQFVDNSSKNKGLEKVVDKTIDELNTEANNNLDNNKKQDEVEGEENINQEKQEEQDDQYGEKTTENNEEDVYDGIDLPPPPKPINI